MLLYTNKKQLYKDKKITRYEFENELLIWNIIVIYDMKDRLKWYIIKNDFIKLILS
jgi:hypothetical protein